ncbi:MAG: metallopeptidase family protein, partial [Planctomycetota bacterium]
QSTWLEEIPIFVRSRPTAEQLIKLGISDSADLAGYYSAGVGQVATIHLFRLGICQLVLDRQGTIDEEALAEEIQITILHELAHHKGLGEREVDELGLS